MSRIYTFPTFIHSGGISVSCVYYGFLYFCQLLSLIAVIFIFYLLVIFPSQTRIRVNIKVVRCLKYTDSVLFLLDRCYGETVVTVHNPLQTLFYDADGNPFPTNICGLISRKGLKALKSLRVSNEKCAERIAKKRR